MGRCTLRIRRIRIGKSSCHRCFHPASPHLPSPSRVVSVAVASADYANRDQPEPDEL
jgi:hypothetical protein